MAKAIETVQIFLTTANSNLTIDSLRARYTVGDGDLSKDVRWLVSGVDLSQTYSGVWDDTVQAIKDREGIA